MRATSTGILGAHCNCQTCGWHYEGKNALGLAAQHHDKTEHVVTAEQVLYVKYEKDRHD